MCRVSSDNYTRMAEGVLNWGGGGSQGIAGGASLLGGGGYGGILH